MSDSEWQFNGGSDGHRIDSICHESLYAVLQNLSHRGIIKALSNILYINEYRNIAK